MSLTLPVRVLWRLLVRSILGTKWPWLMFGRDVTATDFVRPPFELPLRIGVLGRSTKLPERVPSPENFPDAVTLTYADVIEHLHADPPYHILIVNQDGLSDALRRYVAPTVAREGWPALVVCTGPLPWSKLGALAWLPRGVAFAAARGIWGRDDAIFKNIVLDRPFATFETSEEPGGPAGILCVDRYSNDALRMADAREMLRQTLDIHGQSTEELAKRPTLGALDEASTFFKRGETFQANTISADITLLRGLFRQDHSRTVTSATTLQAGQQYFLQVHLGNPLPSSVVRRSKETEPDDIGFDESALESSADAPSVLRYDPAAPADTLLEAVIQPKDFTLRSPNRRFLLVSASGVAMPVRFAVTAPDVGDARMRIALFSHNQMVQSFEIQARVTDREYRLAQAEGVVADMEFSQTTSLAEIGELPPRALTISVNDSGGTHDLLVKGHGKVTGLRITDSLVKEQLKRYREILYEATYKGKDARFPATEKDVPNNDSAKFIRRLASLGNDLHDDLYKSDDRQLTPLLNRLSRTEDETITVVRHDFRFAWPWPIFYDFMLPRHNFGSVPHVCFGTKEDGSPCGHNADSNVCCVRGFWGYRHIIEELHGKRTQRRRVSRVEGSNDWLVYVASTRTEPEKAMRERFKHFGSHLDHAPEQLLPVLWDAQTRPAISLVLGHFETKDFAGEPEGPRIVLGRNGAGNPSAWLQASDVMDFVKQRSSWSTPNPIVMMLACESASTSPQTLSNFVLNFLKANASAVIGTECEAFTGLLSRVGAELVTDLLEKGLPLGEAMRARRQRLLRQGIPLAFVLNAIGLADLTVHGFDREAASKRRQEIP